MAGVNQSSEPMSKKGRAAATRRRILEAARELFIEHGYASSTMQSIADRAGVAVQTVYFVFHTKGELLRQLILSFGGRDDEPVETMDRDWVHQAMTDADGHRSVALLVEHGTDIYARIAPLWAAFGQGAAVEPDVAETWQGIVEARRAGIHRIVDSLARRGHLRQDLAVDRAADIVYGLHRPESLAVLVGECGWSLPEYKAWVYRLLCDQLLAPGPDTGPDRSPTQGMSYDAVLGQS